MGVFRLPEHATFFADTNCVRDTKNVSDFVQKHFVSATYVSHFAHPKKHHGQQCVGNNVSSFSRALSMSFLSSLPSVVEFLNQMKRN